MRRIRRLAVLAAAACLVSVVARAASSPFGNATPDISGGGSYFGAPLGPVFAWVAAHQAVFNRALTAALSSLLLGLSFATSSIRARQFALNERRGCYCVNFDSALSTAPTSLVIHD